MVLSSKKAGSAMIEFEGTVLDGVSDEKGDRSPLTVTWLSEPPPTRNTNGESWAAR